MRGSRAGSFIPSSDIYTSRGRRPVRRDRLVNSFLDRVERLDRTPDAALFSRRIVMTTMDRRTTDEEVGVISVTAVLD